MAILRIFPRKQCAQLSWSACVCLFAGACLLLKLIRTHAEDADSWRTCCSKCMMKTTCPNGRGDTPGWPSLVQLQQGQQHLALGYGTVQITYSHGASYLSTHAALWCGCTGQQKSSSCLQHVVELCSTWASFPLVSLHGLHSIGMMPSYEHALITVSNAQRQGSSVQHQ